MADSGSAGGKADEATKKMAAVQAALQAIQSRTKGGFSMGGGAAKPPKQPKEKKEKKEKKGTSPAEGGGDDAGAPAAKKPRERSPSSSSSESDECRITGGVVCKVVPKVHEISAEPTAPIALDEDDEVCVSMPKGSIDLDAGGGSAMPKKAEAPAKKLTFI
eukprot:TRINITY_DN13714_c0_g1_i1.p2 TRINITY_DN13714_c0_g1~~TRINITY_DN13714_c0_g1_i1.p2  ORF type:complete len:178 (-),score=71.33 TRINITY_DN13714_c0_g1_i1:322-804(-)